MEFHKVQRRDGDGELLVEAGLCKSNGDARRLVQGGGAYLNDVRIDSADRNIMKNEIPAGGAILKAGKKNIKRIVAQ